MAKKQSQKPSEKASSVQPEKGKGKPNSQKEAKERGKKSLKKESTADLAERLVREALADNVLCSRGEEEYVEACLDALAVIAEGLEMRKQELAKEHGNF